ncbi:MAG TPA: bifunctional phosphopantothenoylcysteine decarboxylase/phosphopantothenate--cysteine ligase CoaBC [Pseudomonadota bacterium]|nr:bifunctional phosphopantothenoylcysteine decarboxylase/phosphopantothenate--cysteine ligase CoaBC [Pseudomonadota bacterium]
MASTQTPAPLSGRRVLLGVSGGIAAYKTPELVRQLTRAGAVVNVVMTAAAAQFVTPLALATVSGNAVGTDLFDLSREAGGSGISHIDLADRAELLLIAPATADLLARLSLGLADDLLTTIALACRAPLLLAPAMNVNMWQHATVQEHVQRLLARGAQLVGPDAGELACGWVGAGRMSEPVEIVARVIERLAPPARPLSGRKVLISAGPTYEALDPVRFIGNRSSGKMGFALAAAAAERGAEVVLVAGPVALPTPPGVQRIDIESAAQLAEQVLAAQAAGDLDAVIMTAAVADFRPAQVAAQKLKKNTLSAGLTVQLEPTLDVLAELGRRRGAGRQPLLVGFAAETHDVVSYARGKLEKKGCDVVVANDVSEPGSGFGADDNRVTVIRRALPPGGEPDVEALPKLPKSAVAAALWERLTPLLPPPAAR